MAEQEREVHDLAARPGAATPAHVSLGWPAITLTLLTPLKN
jgi:hypothetical protein